MSVKGNLELEAAAVVIGVPLVLAGVAVWLTAEGLIQLSKYGKKILLTEGDKQRQIKYSKGKSLENKLASKSEVEQPERMEFQTKFTNETLLENSIKNVGFAYNKNGRGKYICNLPNNVMTFNKNRDGIYELIVEGNCNVNEIQAFYNKLGSEYEKQLQAIICNNIREKVVKNSSMKLFSEETLEDGSVVLTIDV